MRILLTAFEPFDGTGLNSSLEACRHFLAWGRGASQLRFAVLPVAYGPDVEAVDRALDEEPADLILHTGQAAGSTVLRVERIAVNVRYGRDDAADRDDQFPIEVGGPVGLHATIPVELVSATIRAAGPPAVVSNHAGIYLCNHALYQSLRRAERWGLSQQVGFLHLPALPEQAGEKAPSLPVEVLARGVEAAVRCLSTPGER